MNAMDLELSLFHLCPMSSIPRHSLLNKIRSHACTYLCLSIPSSVNWPVIICKEMDVIRGISNKPFERTGRHQLSAPPPQASCLPLRRSVSGTPQG
jgi:hypothetical protein